MSVSYRMRKWYDHWLVMGRVRGSVIPRTLLSIGTALILNALFHEVIIPPAVLGEGGGLLNTPTVYTLFTTSASFILAFTTGICYNRFWEALSHMYQMSNRMSIAATLALAQDPSVFESAEVARREKRWRAEFLHDISVLHAVCIQSLFSEYVEAPLDILGGMTQEEQAQLAAVKNQPALVFNWIAGSICSRLHTDKVNVMLNNCTSQMSMALTDWNNAQKVSRVPLPLPFQQALAWSDLIILIFTPIVIACFTYDLWMSLAMTFAAELIYHGVYMANVAMQQPFGVRSTDLPLVSVHREFIKRILSFVTSDLVEELNSMFVAEEAKDKDAMAPETTSARFGLKTISLTDFPAIVQYKSGLRPCDFPYRNKSEPALSPPPAESSESDSAPKISSSPSKPNIATDEPSTHLQPSASPSTHWRNSFLDAARPPQLQTYRSTLLHDKFTVAVEGGSTRPSIDRPPEGVFVGDKLLAKEYVMPREMELEKSTPMPSVKRPSKSHTHRRINSAIADATPAAVDDIP